MKKDVSKAVCAECGKPVTPEANIGGMVCMDADGKRRFIFNHVYTYWHCRDHGAVWAYIDGELVTKPSHLFDVFEFDDWDAKVYRKEAPK